jgi:hypothetical protein
VKRKTASVVVNTDRVEAIHAYTVFTGFYNLQRMTMAGETIGFGDPEKGRIKEDDRGLGDAKALDRAIVRHIQSCEFPAK